MLGYPIGKPFGTARIVFVWAFVLASVLLLREPDADWSHYGGDWLELASAMGRKAVIALHLAVFFAFTAILSRSGVLHGGAVGLEMAELQDTKDKLHYLGLILPTCPTYFGVFALLGSLLTGAFFAWMTGLCDVRPFVGGLLYAGIPTLLRIVADAAGVLEGLRDSRMVASWRQQHSISRAAPC